MANFEVRWKEILLIALALLLCLIACEVFLRVFSAPVYKSSRYGWFVPAMSQERITVEDSHGKFREIDTRTFQNGFKRWGDIYTKKVKIMIVGDSFTMMSGVSNGEEWYSYLEKEFKNAEFFIYGGPGYGSLQEFMILNDFIEKINPQIVLFQFCNNDFTDNFYQLDKMFYPFNNVSFKPYWEDNKIIYRMPVPFSKLREVSFLAGRILAAYDVFILSIFKKDMGFYERKIGAKIRAMSRKKQQKLEKRAFEVTNEIYSKIRERVDRSVPLFLLNIQDDPRVEAICQANNIACLSGIKEALELKKKDGACVSLINNNHWNKLGNEVVGKKLVECLIKDANAKRLLRT